MLRADSKHAFTNASTAVDGEVDQFAAANNKVCREIWAKLQQFYPGHPWAVGCSHEQGMAQVFLPTFTKWSFNIRLNDYYSDPSGLIVKQGAGEFLERYEIPRSGFDTAHYLAAQKRFMPRFTSKILRD